MAASGIAKCGFDEQQLSQRTPMSLSVNHPDADRLAHLLAERMGVSLDEAVVDALRERLAGVGEEQALPRPGELLAIGRECAALPDFDRRSADEILGYDDYGVPQ
jgi:antitoxin VapB